MISCFSMSAATSIPYLFVRTSYRLSNHIFSSSKVSGRSIAMGNKKKNSHMNSHIRKKNIVKNVNDFYAVEWG